MRLWWLQDLFFHITFCLGTRAKVEGGGGGQEREKGSVNGATSSVCIAGNWLT